MFCGLDVELKTFTTGTLLVVQGLALMGMICTGSHSQ